MDLANVEMVIFDVGGSGFGTEVSRIISILRPREENEQVSNHANEQMSKYANILKGIGSPGARENLESVPLVNLSMQLGTGERGSREARERGSEEARKQGSEEAGKRGGERAEASSLKSIPDVGSDIGRSQGSPLQRPTDGDGTAILLVDTTAGAKGVQVESVRGIVKMPLEQIEPLPEFLKSRMQTDCIWGIGKLEQELIILLDLDRYVIGSDG